MKFAVVDIETTGTVHGRQAVTEIAVVHVDDGHITHRYQTLIDPQWPIHPQVIALTGIYPEMLQGAPSFEEVADTLHELTSGRVFVAHNVNFDYKILGQLLKEVGKPWHLPTLCTVRLSRHFFPGLPSYSLGKLCKELQIPLEDRHRAMGDAYATALLFQRMWNGDDQGYISSRLKGRGAGASLPSGMNASDILEMPEAPGVYYFRSKKGKVLYVGKAINLRQRVRSHFYDRKAGEVDLCRETHSVSWALAGSELLALLMEASEIRRHYPKYNKAQKRQDKGYAITAFRNQHGLWQFTYLPRKQVRDPLWLGYSISDCRAKLAEIREEYRLCTRYTHLSTGKESCAPEFFGECGGFCKGEEEVNAYNDRAEQALESLRVNRKSFVVLAPGREKDEYGIAVVDQGVYKGFGFVPADVWETNKLLSMRYIEFHEMELEILSIIRGCLEKDMRLELVPIEGMEGMIPSANAEKLF